MLFLHAQQWFKKSLNCQCSLDIGFVCGLFDRASAMFRLSRAARTPLTVEWSLEINHCRTKILFKQFLSFNKHFFMYVLNTNYFHIICTTHSTPHGGTLVLSLMVECDLPFSRWAAKLTPVCNIPGLLQFGAITEPKKTANFQWNALCGRDSHDVPLHHPAYLNQCLTESLIRSLGLPLRNSIYALTGVGYASRPENEAKKLFRPAMLVGLKWVLIERGSNWAFVVAYIISRNDHTIQSNKEIQ